ncbi:hypothetical protein [Aeromonas bestiarum]|nr:hypothetical protein [Aeromonas bestiarum]
MLEIAWRIFGERSYEGKGLLQRLTSNERGVLGWNDLMLFRLLCSADRRGQIYNLQKALIIHQDKNAPTDGLVSMLTLLGMRKLSQETFRLFNQTYIIPRRNFFAEVNDTPDETFLGEVTSLHKQLVLRENLPEQYTILIGQRIASARSIVKSFVIYQLSNASPPNGSGVGCGYYDESGTSDDAGISRLVNEYVFGFCFNPDLNLSNILHFLDYCLSNLSRSFRDDERGYFASKSGLSGGLDLKRMGIYWSKNQKAIRQKALDTIDRTVITSNYIASYKDDLPEVFTVLDELANEAVDTSVEIKPT